MKVVTSPIVFGLEGESIITSKIVIKMLQNIRF